MLRSETRRGLRVRFNKDCLDNIGRVRAGEGSTGTILTEPDEKDTVRVKMDRKYYDINYVPIDILSIL